METSVPVVLRPCVSPTQKHHRARCMEAPHICKKEERHEVDERIRQLLVLFQGDPNLFPPDGKVAFSLRQGRSRAGLLENDCTGGARGSAKVDKILLPEGDPALTPPDAKEHPIAVRPMPKSERRVREFPPADGQLTERGRSCSLSGCSSAGARVTGSGPASRCTRRYCASAPFSATDI